MSLNESIVEDAALTWFGELGYAIAHGPQLAPGEAAAERESFGDVVLEGRLRDAIRRLNPAIPEEAREDALRKVLRVGVAVEYPRADGSIAGDHARLVDFGDATANDWLAVNQFTVIEGQHNRRPDIVVFVNGLPLAVIELKNATDEEATIWSAFNQLQTYQQQIGSLFHYNEVLVVSDARQRFERIAIMRHRAAMALDQQTAGCDQVLGLAAVQPDSPDSVLQPLLAERRHGLRRVGDGKQPGGGKIDALVGGLGDNSTATSSSNGVR